MDCGNYHCAFWHGDRCLLPKITLDERGCCQNCFMLDPGDEAMQPLRNTVLKTCGLPIPEPEEAKPPRE